MECKKAKKLISLYLDGEIEGPQQDILLGHLDSCQECKQEMKVLSTLMEKVSATPDIEPSPYFFVKIKQKIKAEAGHPLLQLLLSPRNALLIASAVVVAVFAGIFLGETSLFSQAAIETASEDTISDLNSGAMRDMPKESFTQAYDNIIGG